MQNKKVLLSISGDIYIYIYIYIYINIYIHTCAGIAVIWILIHVYITTLTYNKVLLLTDMSHYYVLLGTNSKYSC